MRHHYREFYKVARFLKGNLPFQGSVVIRRVVLHEDNDGDCTFQDNRFIIRIEKRLPEYYATEVLIHELAHALSWDKDRDAHGKHWGIAYSRVYRLYLKYLVENSVTMNSKTPYHLNEHYLDYIESEDKAYWLGFLNADYCVSREDDSFTIKLPGIDVDHLCKFSRSVGSDHKLVYSNQGVYGSVAVTVKNRHLCERLNRRYHELPDNLHRHFWRGYVDGNGELNLRYHRSKNMPCPQLCLEVIGTEELANLFFDFCYQYKESIKARVAPTKHGFRLRLYGQTAMVICHLLYDDADFFLDRKLQKFIEITKIIEDHNDEKPPGCMK